MKLKLAFTAVVAVALFTLASCSHEEKTEGASENNMTETTDSTTHEHEHMHGDSTHSHSHAHEGDTAMHAH